MTMSLAMLMDANPTAACTGANCTAAAHPTGALGLMLLICGYGVCLFMGLLCALLLYKFWIGKNGGIDLSTLVAEQNGSASMSRFQLLVFTLMIAISVFIIVERNGCLPDIPSGVLTLLGISASTYAVGKGISYSREEGVTTPEDLKQKRAAIAQMAPAAQVAAMEKES